MTTTSQQPPAPEPSEGRRRDAVGGGRRVALIVLAVVVVAAIAVVGWVFTAGPMSESASQSRDVESALEDMSASSSFAEFNSHLCAEQRVPQDLVDTITASGEQTGTDLDAMFRESITGSLPENMEVTGVEINGADATATVESGDEDAPAEEVVMREEDGAWKVCDQGVGMGTVPETE